MEQPTDVYGVAPEGVMTNADLAAVAVRLLAKDVYIARLRAEIERLRAEYAPASSTSATGGWANGAEAFEMAEAT
jgi:uncharacterized small protein (DUF1192 family)